MFTIFECLMIVSFEHHSGQTRQGTTGSPFDLGIMKLPVETIFSGYFLGNSVC